MVGCVWSFAHPWGLGGSHQRGYLPRPRAFLNRPFAPHCYGWHPSRQPAWSAGSSYRCASNMVGHHRPGLMGVRKGAMHALHSHSEFCHAGLMLSMLNFTAYLSLRTIRKFLQDTLPQREAGHSAVSNTNRGTLHSDTMSRRRRSFAERLIERRRLHGTSLVESIEIESSCHRNSDPEADAVGTQTFQTVSEFAKLPDLSASKQSNDEINRSMDTHSVDQQNDLPSGLHRIPDWVRVVSKELAEETAESRRLLDYYERQWENSRVFPNDTNSDRRRSDSTRTARISQLSSRLSNVFLKQPTYKHSHHPLGLMLSERSFGTMNGHSNHPLKRFPHHRPHQSFGFQSYRQFSVHPSRVDSDPKDEHSMIDSDGSMHQQSQKISDDAVESEATNVIEKPRYKSPLHRYGVIERDVLPGSADSGRLRRHDDVGRKTDRDRVLGKGVAKESRSSSNKPSRMGYLLMPEDLTLQGKRTHSYSKRRDRNDDEAFPEIKSAMDTAVEQELREVRHRQINATVMPSLDSPGFYDAQNRKKDVFHSNVFSSDYHGRLQYQMPILDSYYSSSVPQMANVQRIKAVPLNEETLHENAALHFDSEKSKEYTSDDRTHVSAVSLNEELQYYLNKSDDLTAQSDNNESNEQWKKKMTTEQENDQKYHRYYGVHLGQPMDLQFLRQNIRYFDERVIFHSLDGSNAKVLRICREWERPSLLSLSRRLRFHSPLPRMIGQNGSHMQSSLQKESFTATPNGIGTSPKSSGNNHGDSLVTSGSMNSNEEYLQFYIDSYYARFNVLSRMAQQFEFNDVSLNKIAIRKKDLRDRAYAHQCGGVSISKDNNESMMHHSQNSNETILSSDIWRNISDVSDPYSSSTIDSSRVSSFINEMRDLEMKESELKQRQIKIKSEIQTYILTLVNGGPQIPDEMIDNGETAHLLKQALLEEVLTMYFVSGIGDSRHGLASHKSSSLKSNTNTNTNNSSTTTNNNNNNSRLISDKQQVLEEYVVMIMALLKREDYDHFLFDSRNMSAMFGSEAGGLSNFQSGRGATAQFESYPKLALLCLNLLEQKFPDERFPRTCLRLCRTLSREMEVYGFGENNHRLSTLRDVLHKMAKHSPAFFTARSFPALLMPSFVHASNDGYLALPLSVLKSDHFEQCATNKGVSEKTIQEVRRALASKEGTHTRSRLTGHPHADEDLMIAPAIRELSSSLATYNPMHSITNRHLELKYSMLGSINAGDLAYIPGTLDGNRELVYWFGRLQNRHNHMHVPAFIGGNQSPLIGLRMMNEVEINAHRSEDSNRSGTKRIANVNENLSFHRRWGVFEYSFGELPLSELRYNGTLFALTKLIDNYTYVFNGFQQSTLGQQNADRVVSKTLSMMNQSMGKPRFDMNVVLALTRDVCRLYHHNRAYVEHMSRNEESKSISLNEDNDSMHHNSNDDDGMMNTSNNKSSVVKGYEGALQNNKPSLLDSKRVSGVLNFVLKKLSLECGNQSGPSRHGLLGYRDILKFVQMVQSKYPLMQWDSSAIQYAISVSPMSHKDMQHFCDEWFKLLNHPQFKQVKHSFLYLPLSADVSVIDCYSNPILASLRDKLKSESGIECAVVSNTPSRLWPCMVTGNHKSRHGVVDHAMQKKVDELLNDYSACFADVNLFECDDKNNLDTHRTLKTLAIMFRGLMLSDSTKPMRYFKDKWLPSMNDDSGIMINIKDSSYAHVFADCWHLFDSSLSLYASSSGGSGTSNLRGTHSYFGTNNLSPKMINCLLRCDDLDLATQDDCYLAAKRADKLMLALYKKKAPELALTLFERTVMSGSDHHVCCVASLMNNDDDNDSDENNEQQNSLENDGMTKPKQPSNVLGVNSSENEVVSPTATAFQNHPSFSTINLFLLTLYESAKLEPLKYWIERIMNCFPLFVDELVLNCFNEYIECPSTGVRPSMRGQRCRMRDRQRIKEFYDCLLIQHYRSFLYSQRTMPPLLQSMATMTNNNNHHFYDHSKNKHLSLLDKVTDNYSTFSDYIINIIVRDGGILTIDDFRYRRLNCYHSLQECCDQILIYLYSRNHLNGLTKLLQFWLECCKDDKNQDYFIFCKTLMNDANCFLPLFRFLSNHYQWTMIEELFTLLLCPSFRDYVSMHSDHNNNIDNNNKKEQHHRSDLDDHSNNNDDNLMEFQLTPQKLELLFDQYSENLQCIRDFDCLKVSHITRQKLSMDFVMTMMNHNNTNHDACIDLCRLLLKCVFMDELRAMKENDHHYRRRLNKTKSLMNQHQIIGNRLLSAHVNSAVIRLIKVYFIAAYNRGLNRKNQSDHSAVNDGESSLSYVTKFEDPRLGGLSTFEKYIGFCVKQAQSQLRRKQQLSHSGDIHSDEQRLHCLSHSADLIINALVRQSSLNQQSQLSS